MNKKTIRDIDFAGKRVLMRVDFNVPLADGVVEDDTRIRAAIPTIETVLEQSPQYIVLLSHLGRPKGEPKAELSLEPVAMSLCNLLGKPVAFASDCVGEIAEGAIAALDSGGILLLENTRFHPGETKNEQEFARQLAQLGDVFVNDAFGTAHRAHASNVGISSHLPAVAGLLLEKEITYLAQTIANPQRPFVAILGGAKVSGKIEVIEALLDKVEHLLIGGGMANTFFAAQGYEMADSLVENEALEIARELLSKSNGKIVLPVDAIIADRFDNDAKTQIIEQTQGVPQGWQILDIGPNTRNRYAEILQDAKTVVWNGPMGVFEMPNFAQGTFAIAQALAEITDQGAVTIIGGGDSASAAEKSGLADRITHIATGGGASLEMLEGKTLPGLAALLDQTE